MTGHLTATILRICLGVFAAVTVVVVTYLGIKRSESPRLNLFKLLFSLAVAGGEIWLVHFLNTSAWADQFFGPLAKAIIIPISIAVTGVVLGVAWTPQISGALFSPLTNALDGGGEKVELKPLYSIAQAKRKRGQAALAVAEVRQQLARFPNDFEGIMLLASILAEDMHDLPGATITLNRYSDADGAPPRLAAVALTQLADWHLKLTADVEAARAALQKIVERYPGTESALQAQQRIAHLAATGQMILEQHDRQAVALPEGVQNVGLLESTEFLRPKEIEPGQLAAAYVKQLAQYPEDVETREKLAVIYATHFRRLDLAAMELEQLIAKPNFSAKQVAHWLNLLAGFQVELGANVATVCGTLQRIVEKYPNTPTAELAQRRLARVNLEIKGRATSANIQLGTYEPKAGLKYGRPGSLPGQNSN